MFLLIILSYLLAAELCVAFFSVPILATQDSACQYATKAGQDPSCWTALGCNSWIDTWRGTCPASPSCTYDVSKPWSDCVLDRYQAETGGSNTGSSCVDLSKPEACHIPSDDWTKMSENQLAIAYVSTAISNLYRFMYEWYKTIMTTPAPPAILNTLLNQIDDLSQHSDNQTKINIATFLSSLMTEGHTNDPAFPNFKAVISQAITEDKSVDVSLMDIIYFQNALGQVLNETLIAILADWNTSYFNTVAKNGAFLHKYQLQTNSPLSQTLNQPPVTSLSNDTTTLPTNLTLSKTSSRTLLSTPDSTEIWDYQILSCDAAEPSSLATHLIALLDTFHKNLYHVMVASSKGARSPFGFSQLFKTRKWIPIRRLYEYMYNAVGTAGILASSPVLPDNRPILICLQPHKRETSGAYAVCAAQPRLRAFSLPGTPNAIGLCPAFWALPMGPVRAFCPSKGEVSQEYTGDALLLNQQSVLVMILVRMYLGSGVLVPERIGLKEVLALGSEDSYWNPSTWAYWFSSVTGCTPTSWKDPDLR